MLTFSVHLSLRTEGFLDPAVERRGFVAHHATFGAHRTPTRLELPPAESTTLQLGPYTLPAAETLRGDEAVCVEQYAYTHTSGVPDLDAKDGDHVRHENGAGMLRLPVLSLLEAALDAGAAQDVPVYDRILFASLSRAGDAADTAAIKGMARIVVDLGSDRTLAARYRAILERAADRTDMLLYGTPRHLELQKQVQELLFAAHADYFFPLDGRPAPRYGVTPTDPGCDRLHLISYENGFGWLPAACYLCNSPDARPVAPGVDGAALRAEYSAKPGAVLYFESQLAAACRRYGMTGAAFVRAIADQHGKGRDDTSISTLYKHALAVIASVGTYPANSIHYTSDMRFRRPTASATGQPLGYSTRRLWGGYQSLQAHFGAGESEGRQDVEDWSIAAQCGVSSCDDCEGSGTLAMAILDAMQDVAAAHMSARLATIAPLLAAAQGVLERFYVLMPAANVTSSFVNTNGDKVTRKDLKDLPMIGDALDQKSETAGHALGWWHSVAQVAVALEAGGHDLHRDLPPLAAAAARASAWERTAAPILILEGTGAQEPFVLPAAEWSGGEFTATAAATRAVYGYIRDKAPTLLAAARMRNMAFYDEVQPPTRRVSSFYRSLSFVMSRRLMAMNPLYGTLAVVDPVSKTRGVDVGTALRPANAGKWALVSAFAEGVGAVKWKALVEPLIACVQNQMPLSTIGCFAAQPSLEQVLQLQSQPLGGRGPEQPPQQPLVPTAVLTLPAWRMDDATQRAGILKELAALESAKLIDGYTLTRHRPLHQCTDTIDLTLRLRVL